MNKEDKKDIIINHLLNNTGYTKASELSKLLSVSSKSIYRLIKEINNTTVTKCICSERGKGYFVNPLFDTSELISDSFTNSGDLTMSPIERRNEIVKDLLINSPKPISVNHIINKYFVSESVLSTDEKYIIESLQYYKLHLVRKSRTLAIKGEESSVRTALMKYMETIHIDFEQFTNIPRNIEEKDMNFVNKQIKIIEKTLNVTISYPYNINIISHLYILILRFRKNGNCIGDEVSQNRKNTDNLDPSYYRVCDIIIKNFEKYLSSKLPVSEKEYLYKYLISYRVENIEGFEEKEINFSQEIRDLTDQWLVGMGEVLNHDFSNKAFRIDFMKHIKPMVNRVKNEIIIKNNLLNQIKFEYPEIYRQTAIISKNIIKSISDDEIGFLSLYFAREIERNPRRIRTLITCTTGIGTSELLRVKVEKNLPEIEIVDVISSDVVNKKTLDDIDLIISTVAIKEFKSKPVIVVSAMFNKNDQFKLKQLIEKMSV
ncbi:BglG family transcription antiterminator [Staphylococcus equorum]|uniref:BglG family transcription antiterminator n=1 Tax=Staphylococcus equorum TaxID=246432 RepID=UPI000913B88B|nr:PRD domain-containing protein [Staphylococcus equorum]OIS61472.1 hypothetical protein A4A34_02955 [Staphylococcus equorum]